MDIDKDRLRFVFTEHIFIHSLAVLGDTLELYGAYHDPLRGDLEFARISCDFHFGYDLLSREYEDNPEREEYYRAFEAIAESVESHSEEIIDLLEGHIELCGLIYKLVPLEHQGPGEGRAYFLHDAAPPRTPLISLWDCLPAGNPGEVEEFRDCLGGDEPEDFRQLSGLMAAMALRFDYYSVLADTHPGREEDACISAGLDEEMLLPARVAWTLLTQSREPKGEGDGSE